MGAGPGDYGMMATKSSDTPGNTGTRMRHLRFIFLTQYYPPEPGAASLRLQAMAQELTRLGHEVTVVTAFPHHLGARQTETTRGRIRVEETVRGIRVFRTWIFRVATGRFWLRLMNYFSFVVSSWLGLARVGPADYLLVESPPLFLGITAYLYGRWRRVPYILSVSDLWPASAVALGLVRNRALIWATRLLERFLYRRAAYVSCVTEGIREGVLATGAVDANRVLFFPNGVDLALFRRSVPDTDLVARLGVAGRHVFLYPGTLGYAQGLDVIIEAADLLRDREDIRFLLVGEGPVKRHLMDEAARRGLDNVLFEPLQPVERMAAYLSLARGVVVPLKRHALFRGARPSKVFPAWAAEVPVIYVGEGEMSRLVEESGGGLVVPPEDSPALAMAVDFLARIGDDEWRLMGRSGYRYVEGQYSWGHIARRWLTGLTAGG